MKKYYILCPLLFCLFYICAEDVVMQAESYFNSGDISQGRWTLLQGLRDESISIVDQARIQNKVAWFYEELVGNFEEAIRYSRRVLTMQLNESHPVKKEAAERIQRLEKFFGDYDKQNRLVQKVRFETKDKNEALQRIREMNLIIRTNPDYPGISMVYYYLGIHHMILEEYHNAYLSFQKAKKSRPGLEFMLPVKNKMSVAFEKWVYSLCSFAGFWGLVLMSVIALVVFLLSRPWIWIKLWQLVVPAVFVIAWILVVLLINWIIGFSVSETGYSFEEPSFIENTPWSPGSSPLYKLLFYFIPPFFILFLFVTGTGKLTMKISALFLNALFAVLLFLCAGILFYLNQSYNKSIFEPGKNKLFSLVTGKSYFFEQDMEPYILINPRAYPGLDLSNVDEYKFKEWILEQNIIIENFTEKENDK